LVGTRTRRCGTKIAYAADRSAAVAERWVGTVRRECLDQLLIVGRQQLARVLRTYIEHYNRRRPHRSLGHAALVSSGGCRIDGCTERWPAAPP
jgi:transposase InsO family protein